LFLLHGILLDAARAAIRHRPSIMAIETPATAQTMPDRICPSCHYVLRSAAMFWSGGQRYWSILPHDRERFEATCDQPQKGLGDGISWCPSMRSVLGQEEPAPQPREILGRFQSLGDNCEFGLVQRWAGAEPLDLLRFAGFYAPVEDRLRLTTEALAAGFANLGDPASVVCELREEYRPRQYAVWERRWALLYHPERTEWEIAPDVLHAQQVRVLRFRRHKLLEDMEAAHRIFVWKSNGPTAEADVRALLETLRRYGPNRLLWVSVADIYHPPGYVEDGGNGLLKGYVTRLASYDLAGDADFESWLRVCQNALAIVGR
jgi:hypothetical protein